jgi:hypothetical protein
MDVSIQIWKKKLKIKNLPRQSIDNKYYLSQKLVWNVCRGDNKTLPGMEKH